MAAWQNRPDVVELLLLNGASVKLMSKICTVEPINVETCMTQSLGFI